MLAPSSVGNTAVESTESEDAAIEAVEAASSDSLSSSQSRKPDFSRPAIRAWESMFRATTMLARDLAAGDAWGELSQAEYGVLYALTKDPAGVRITDLGQDVLLSQTGLSRLAARLVDKGLVARVSDPDDGRSCRLVLTARGSDAQRRIGRLHAREITDAIADKLSPEELERLDQLCSRLLD